MSLRYTILGFLSIRPLTGYDLKRHFDNSVRHFWTADQAAIYRTLMELQTEQLVEHERVSQQTRPDRKVYSITDAGREMLDLWLAEPARPAPRREPLLVKLFFAARLSPQALQSLLAAELAAVDEELAQYAHIVAAIDQQVAEGSEQPEIMLGPLITLTNGLTFARTNRRWLQELLDSHQRGDLSVAQLLGHLHGILHDDHERWAERKHQ